MLNQVEHFIETHQLLPRQASCLVGVSGGPDSMVLLHLLHALSARHGWALVVAHLHHGLRGSDADRDRDLVVDFCKKRGLPCEVEQIDLKQLQAEQGLGLEELGRQERYAFFKRVAIKHHLSRIVLGHHRDDHVETLLLNLMRGTGLHGLQGIRVERPLEGVEHIKVVRPLLCVGRDAIECYANEHQLGARYDASNDDQAFLRNRVRHELLPLLEKSYNAQVKEHLHTVSEHIAGVMPLMNQQRELYWQKCCVEAADECVIDLVMLLELDLYWQRELIYRALVYIKGSARGLVSKHVDDVLSVVHAHQGTSWREVQKGLYVLKKQRSLFVSTCLPQS